VLDVNCCSLVAMLCLYVSLVYDWLKQPLGLECQFRKSICELIELGIVSREACREACRLVHYGSSMEH